MGYREALEAAGAKIKDYSEFGDYEGTWVALLDDGHVVVGYYGSCPQCDPFQSELNYGFERGSGCAYSGGNADHRSPNPDCPDCAEIPKKYDEKLKKFGLSYLQGHLATLDETIAECQREVEKHDYFDEMKKILEWLQSKR